MTQNGVENHPLVDDVNAEHQDQLTETEKVCRRIADATGAPIALLLAILVQIIWIVVGWATHWDPFPFVFLLTCSNVLQLILIFVIAVAQTRRAASGGRSRLDLAPALPPGTSGQAPAANRRASGNRRRRSCRSGENAGDVAVLT
jgi:uncharacterized membrane protein